jgi:O-antigen/teichoic acid export membrane protein
MIDQHKTLAEKFLKKGFWLYLFSFIIAPIWYIIKIIISGELSVSDIWILYWIISLITIITAYNDLWMSQSALYFIPRFIWENRYDKVKSFLVYSLIFQLLSGLSIALFFYFGSDFIAQNYFETHSASVILKTFAFFFIAINIFQILNTFFLWIQNTFLSKWLEFIRFLFLLFFTLWVLFFDFWSLENYSYWWIFGLYIWTIVSIIIFFLKYYKKYFKSENIIWSANLFKTILKYSMISFVWTQWATILSQIDMQMIILLLGTTEAWYYTNYLTIVSLSLIFVLPIFNILPTFFSELDSKKEYNKIQNIRTFFNKYFIITGSLIAIIFFLFSSEIAYIFFGEKFIISWNILQFSIPFIVFNILLQINFHLLWWTWNVKQRTKIIYLAIILNIITNYIFISYLWVYWAALATWVGWLFIWFFSEIKIESKYKWIIDYKFLVKNLFIFWAIWLFLNKYVNLNYLEYSKLELLWIIFSISLILFSLFFLMNFKDTKILISNVKNRWK